MSYIYSSFKVTLINCFIIIGIIQVVVIFIIYNNGYHFGVQGPINKELSPRHHFRSSIPKEIRIVIGIPSSQRKNNNYLFQTLRTLFQDKDILTNRYMFILMLSSFNITWKNSVVLNLESQFSKQINSGILQVISPEKDFYPEESLKTFSGDKDKDYAIWMKKQNMDFSYLYRFVDQKFNFKYFLQLEDDVIATSSYLSKMETFIQKYESSDEWIYMHFCRLGFIAKLFRKSDMFSLSEMFKTFYNNIPCDWIMGLFSMGKSYECVKNKASGYLTAQRNDVCMSKLFPTINNSLFQHMGKESSLLGKVQNLIDDTFKP